MSIEAGTKFQISQNIQGYFNAAESMTIITNNGTTVQFTLGDGKGHGAMPLDHFYYLLKKSNLTIIPNKRTIINGESEEQIS
ncbi:hypothetical protein JK635_00485 [Neobacillus sp. YIM B02564]|uniref:Uncharacterized protein n=1 Tax=Neobacillus paridis TaxID=2803862 RepID=A0ABS1THC7_9BACI|nr:hypothetical protein [Neobacillus paridis]MBL4950721.1 hypothetical protein [Neobacillus paridis]